jgi:hypothetical protein
MEKGDKFYRTKSISRKKECVQVLSSEPDYEYLIQVIDLDTKEVKFIHKDKLLRFWKPYKGAVQSSLFEFDKTEYYKNKFKKIKLWAVETRK